jgi:phosphatidylglycerol lysyltransferase
VVSNIPINSKGSDNVVRIERNRIGLWTASLLTALVGLVNLLSAVTPSLPERGIWLKQFFPFYIRVSGHFFAAIIGFILITLAANLLRRKKVAWLLTVSLLSVSIIIHLIKGFDYEESLLSAVLLLQLIAMRQTFTAQSDRPSIGQGIKVLIIALIFTLGYGTAGFYILDRQFGTNFSFQGAIFQTFAMFFTEDNAGLVIKTKFGQFFAGSIYLVGAFTLAYALFMLLRPIVLRNTASNTEKRKAQAIIQEYGKSSLARFTLFDDKSYYFSPSEKSVIAYVAKGRGAVVLGDPIGAVEDRQEAIIGFQQLCDRNDWFPAFYQVSPENLNLYQSLGFRTLQIGEEAVVNLHDFTLKGKANQNLRTAMNRFSKAGYQVEFYQPPIQDDLLAKLKPVSDNWLKMMRGSEKKFSVGWFDNNYLRESLIAVMYTPEGEINAFANLVPQYQKNEMGIDLMRRLAEVENGTMEYLFVSILQHLKDLKYDGFNLGLSALSGVGITEESRRLEKVLKYFYEHLNQFYNFQGLHKFKDKFNPTWEPRYFAYPSLTALPDVIIALVRADSGDRLLDYFKPGD